MVKTNSETIDSVGRICYIPMETTRGLYMSKKENTRWNSEKFIFEKRVNGKWEPDPREPQLMKPSKGKGKREIDYDAFTEAWLKATKKNMTLNAFCEKYQWEGKGASKGARKASTAKDGRNAELRTAQDELGIPRADQFQLLALANPEVKMPFDTLDLLERIRKFHRDNPEIERLSSIEKADDDKVSNSTPNTEKDEKKALADAK